MAGSVGGGGGRAYRGAEVVLHVYDLSPLNNFSFEFGVGAFHSGVEVLGTEYTFGAHQSASSGIFTHTPKAAPAAAFRTAISMGETSMSAADVRAEVAVSERVGAKSTAGCDDSCATCPDRRVPRCRR